MFPRHVSHKLLVAPLRHVVHGAVRSQVHRHSLDQFLIHRALGADVAAELRDAPQARRESVHAPVLREHSSNKLFLR